MNLGKAKTLIELKEKIEKAITIYGAEATWYGWDDGSIIIEKEAFIDSGAYED